MVKNILINILVILTIIIFTSHPLYSQVPPSADRIERSTREVDRLGSEEDMQKRMQKPAQKPTGIKVEAPVVKKEGQKFFVKKIKLAGTESFQAEEFKPIIEKYENRDVTLDELNNLAKEIEKEYLKRGIISACFIPPQDIKEGELTLQVIEAKMGKLDVQKEKKWYFNKEIISSYWTVMKGEVLRYDKISRSLYVMNKNPDRQVRATLHAGKEPGTTDVLLNAIVHPPVHLTGSYDREGAITTGRERKGIGIKDNSLLLVDDTFVSGYTYGSHFSGIYAYHKIPITNFGTSFMYGYSTSRSVPVKEFEQFGIDARSSSATFYAYQDIFDKAEYLGEVYGGLDMKEKSVKMNTTGTTTRDRLRIIKMGLNFVFRSPISVTYISPEFSEGINGLGSKSRTSLSSRIAENIFSKFNFSARHTTVWPLDLQTNVNFKSQLADKKLMPQEEFDLGGIDSVRGYAWGDYQGDNGVQANLELIIPAYIIPKNMKIPYLCAKPLRDYFSGIVFFDYGYAEKRGLREDQAEKDNAQLMGVGAGIRIRMFNQGLIRLEWGFPVGDTPITEGAAAKGRFHFAIDFEDHMPEEIERVQKMMADENVHFLAWEILDEELNRPGSPLRAEIDSYRLTAEEAYKNGDLDKAREYYGKIYTTGVSIYAQAENYVKTYADRKNELVKDHDIALQYYRNKEFEKAKEIWNRIIDDAKTKPLLLEF